MTEAYVDDVATLEAPTEVTPGRITRRSAIWLIVGAGLGAVLRGAVVASSTETAALVVNAGLTAAAGLLAGVGVALLPRRVAALALGIAAGTASVAGYAELGLTAHHPWLGLVTLVTVPLVTAATFTVGMLAGTRWRHRLEAAT